ncbi:MULTISPECIES: neutral zinc metallopeptidase [Nocardiopsidaceae]|uniref:neutral zinc metallopeptidase n=1 Tax=Streptomonospora nanhaiensis TaxID=1323731 RepID=UPI00320A1DC5
MENRPGGERGDAPRPDQPGPADAPSPSGAGDGEGSPLPSEPAPEGEHGPAWPADPAPSSQGVTAAGGAYADREAGHAPAPSSEDGPPAPDPGSTGRYAHPPLPGARQPQGPPTSSWQGPLPGRQGFPAPGRPPGPQDPGTTAHTLHPFHAPGHPAAPGQPFPRTGPYPPLPPHAAPVHHPSAPYHGQPGGHGPWPPPRQPWGQPPPPQRRRGLGVLVGSSVAGTIAVAALVASIVMVSTTPQPEPQPTGTDLSALYDEDLAARPNTVEIDIADHPLYDAPMPEAVDCDTPALDIGSDESWQDFATTTGECLDLLWAPVMDDLGLSSRTPEITVTRESPDTGEEEGYTLAYYESDWNRITVVLPNVRQLSAQIPVDEREDVWIALMGHEYGHHVQSATGILDVSHDMRWNAGSEDDELDTLRRTELQAECMAGIGLRGVTGGDGDVLEVVNANFNSGGDLDTHGSASNRAFWLEQGWSEETVSACNTYGAAPGEVT